MVEPTIEAWRARVLAARAQTLWDLMVTETSSTALLVGEDAAEVADALVADARERGAVTALVSLKEHGFHELDAQLSAVAASLRVPDAKRSRRHGLMQAITLFAEEYGDEAEEAFIEAADTFAVSGPLRTLTQDALEVLSGRGASRRLTAWLRGADLRTATDELDLRALSARTAKRGFVQLTRLIRALGYPGLRVVFSDAEALVELSKGRREVAYTVLRELIDNADSRRGMVATELLVVGQDAILTRKGGVTAHPALASRLLDEGSDRGPLPHTPLVRLEPPVFAELGLEPHILECPPNRADALRAQLRMAQGLPPFDEVEALSVAMESMDARLDKLFGVTRNDGSVFALLSGHYGTGKTHHLLHLEERALADQRPVLRLSVERLDEDLGNPQRHLRRLLEAGVLPIRRRASPLDRLDAWLASGKGQRRLRNALEELAASEHVGAAAARRALRGSSDDALDEVHVRMVLGGVDLESKPGAPTYRRDAYQRLQLWLALIERIEGCDGPVLILDEAENLFRTGVSWAERRTALRTLGFYCGGGLARACVILAVTPDTQRQLSEEADALLDEIDAQATLLAEEDISMLRRRLHGRPIKIPKLSRDDLTELALKAYKLGRRARALRAERDQDEVLSQIVRGASSPREVVRRVAQHVERRAWAGLD